jgi:tRNA (cytidine/uridine-2'-O-)-methyltransferase
LKYRAHFNIVLVHPEIPGNTGSIGRLCVGMQSHLHLVRPLGFEITDKQLRRAGLDYWPHLDWTEHGNVDAWWSHVVDPSRVYFFSALQGSPYYDIRFQVGDWLVFGSETRGLPSELLTRFAARTYSIPYRERIRGYNLATAAAMVMGEGLRQRPLPAEAP